MPIMDQYAAHFADELAVARARIAELEEFKSEATDRLQVLTMALMRIECETDCDHARALAKAAFWKQPE